ncbi:hypothetical protein CC80DRAFT_18124 [Byssothecium circinans]|uniref:Secreted protein n=1 Tax=Byssothecium circinans TaxID=147558 RepID=A0A6A5U239_9PLEO|nr:hypothetical protein CC80DRAFT_18124 [Byssothecium circinans]
MRHGIYKNCLRLFLLLASERIGTNSTPDCLHHTVFQLSAIPASAVLITCTSVRLHLFLVSQYTCSRAPYCPAMDCFPVHPTRRPTSLF